jgi:hypothetical protein
VQRSKQRFQPDVFLHKPLINQIKKNCTSL